MTFLRMIGWIPTGLAALLLGSSSVAKLGVVEAKPLKIVAHASNFRPAFADARALKHVSAWTLTSDAEAFGGISAMLAGRTSLLFVADDGTFFSLPKPIGKETQLSGHQFGLPSGCGQRDSKKDHDSEALALTPDRVLWVGLEWTNRLCQIALGKWSQSRLTSPDAMRQWPLTGGSEAMLTLEDGRLVVFAERAADDGPESPILVFPAGEVKAGTRPMVLRFRPPTGFNVSDAAMLLDGRMLVLARSLNLPFVFGARLLLVDAPDWSEGAVMEGREILRLEAPGIHDNFEAIGVSAEGKRTMIWLASDDNHLPLQKTWLLKLEVHSK